LYNPTLGRNFFKNSLLLPVGSKVKLYDKVIFAGAVPAMKPEAIAIGNISRWPLENNLNV